MKTKLKFKQIIVFSLLFTAIIFTLTACGSSDAPDSAEITTENVFGDFQTIDLDKNPVDNSIFSDKTLTMVNIWGTYCSPCIKEMPDLGEINREYADKGFQIIGIPIDAPASYGAVNEYVIADAKDIISDTKADYLHILPSNDIVTAKLSEVSAVPETIFVDKDGNQVGESYIGSRSKDAWITIIDGFLANMN